MILNMAEHSFEARDNVIVADPPMNAKAVSFAEAACDAMDHPLDLSALSMQKLTGKKIAILIDDWGRPTPCSEFLPDVLKRLKVAGADEDNITIITASGMHDPMNDEQMMAKVGKEVFCKVRCISHDGGNSSMLAYCGVTQQGTPVWVNRYVTEADFRIAFGRLYPHSNYGYEGGYKMIVPGVASFETILRDHSLNFSDNSNYGILKNNPSRIEADEIGRLIGLDFIVNFVINWEAKPVCAFGGTVESVFPAGVRFGQHNVWGATTGGEPVDITIVCHKEIGDLSLSNNPTYYIGLAKTVTRQTGIVISTMQYTPQIREMLFGYDLDNMPIGELVRLHEKRNWNLDPREIQHTIKTIRGVFYRRREFELRPQKLFFVSTEYPKYLLERWNAEQFPTLQAAYDEACRRKGQEARVFLIPDAKHTLPLVWYDFE